MDGTGDPERQQALEQYKNKLLESREWEGKLKSLRLGIRDLQKEVCRMVIPVNSQRTDVNQYETTEENIKALQSVGQIIGEVLKQLDEERCKNLF
jgi:26S proteasome regulatory subunit T4